MKDDLLQLISAIKSRGYHNHRLEEHSDHLVDIILERLRSNCQAIREDIENGVIKTWKNQVAPAGRKRNADLLIAEPDLNGEPKSDSVRLAIENKSVITAHRNRDARYDDLNGFYKTLHGYSPRCIIVGTVIVGYSPRVLNIPDRVKPRFRAAPERFDSEVLPRLSSGDDSLWHEFPEAVSQNRARDPSLTVDKFRSLPIRDVSDTHASAFDCLFLIPVDIDNVNTPRLASLEETGIDVHLEYQSMIEKICQAYTVRWRRDLMKTL